MSDAPTDSTHPEAPTGRDYRETVFLPETPFPMRGGLPQKEPLILEQWGDLYSTLRSARQAEGAPLYVLHDGPPYANGDIHIGHALNKTLKDFVVRSRFLLGYDVDFVPGWDCHGLPIEWKIEEQYRAKGRRKDEVSKAEFRAACREYAAGWIEVQKAQFLRLGITGDFANRYATMDYGSEAAIVKEFHKFKNSGQLYRGSKPVMWSPVERTALADAEIEYHDHVSPTIWVKFPVIAATDDHPDDLLAFRRQTPSIVIWTTTPWTIPANRAISFGPEIAYGLYEVQSMEQGLEFEPWAKQGDRLILADKLAEEVFKAAKIATWTRLDDINPSGLVAAHPLAELDDGYRFNVPLLDGDHVTDDAGTGFVHTAPGHGADDYDVWKAHGHHEVPDTVDPDGAYYPAVPLFPGLKVLETEGKKTGKFGSANPAVIEKLIEAGTLLARGRLEHSYPHSWRSKAPVIFRNTPQWFIRMDKALDHADGATLRETALTAIDQTDFHPAAGKNRIRSMVEGRPDWLISRQRAWGTPLAMFVDKHTGHPLHDPEVDARIVAAIEQGGADAWYTRADSDFLGLHDPANYEKIEDILDVWFDSGCTHAFTLETRDPAHGYTGDRPSHWPANLYLEGSDQHRGWFQSNLLEGSGTRGRAPYDAVLTHGFTQDENGEKMSKSRGNTTDPAVVIKESGADILRLWVALVDYAEDQRIGKQILQTTVDAYRKLRNTVRYLLGALADFDEAERVDYADMPPLERFILHRLWELDLQVRGAYETYRFQDVVRPVLEFCAGDLSALYFDIRKDSLYCDRPDAIRRRAARTVMHEVFLRLTAWLAPLTPFTMEEAWTTRYPEGGTNCARVIPETPSEWRNPDEAARWAKVNTVLDVVTVGLEESRRAKFIGGALDAWPTVTLPAEAFAAFDGLDPAEVFRTSGAEMIVSGDTISATIKPADHAKCARSWRRVPDVGSDPAYPDLSARDADAVRWWDARHA
ncbi:isoleucine--tRNA ligase [Brevundimonas subvibrioides]|uniref:Isoleucine--tRNA ligase n=1 Tax=Brevundimonas subvibrioides (strain ATCC 15264 / DSM 4735 / LMG 14903 / NBRC 16000 / CB 81) TaxID=633149 RepID=D9QJI8_BRESC|nr:isoleucine--tRNA ligase [Brevundimonas subvibrioides]ADL01549.1 isoleucyl-tRNA synthetase [Brevundimonas subvibrioides ATCC 15264]